jgi:hypothetical protein
VRFLIRCLALIVLMAICTQMAVCMAEDYRGDADSSTAPVGSDCSCHDCGCCSLHVGFPPETQLHPAFLIERVTLVLLAKATEKPALRLDHPPRS